MNHRTLDGISLHSLVVLNTSGIVNPGLRKPACGGHDVCTYTGINAALHAGQLFVVGGLVQMLGGVSTEIHAKKRT